MEAEIIKNSVKKSILILFLHFQCINLYGQNQFDYKPFSDSFLVIGENHYAEENHAFYIDFFKSINIKTTLVCERPFSTEYWIYEFINNNDGTLYNLSDFDTTDVINNSLNLWVKKMKQDSIFQLKAIDVGTKQNLVTACLAIIHLLKKCESINLLNYKFVKLNLDQIALITSKEMNSNKFCYATNDSMLSTIKVHKSDFINNNLAQEYYNLCRILIELNQIEYAPKIFGRIKPYQIREELLLINFKEVIASISNTNIVCILGGVHVNRDTTPIIKNWIPFISKINLEIDKKPILINLFYPYSFDFSKSKKLKDNLAFQIKEFILNKETRVKVIETENNKWDYNVLLPN